MFINGWPLKHHLKVKRLTEAYSRALRLVRGLVQGSSGVHRSQSIVVKAGVIFGRELEGGRRIGDYQVNRMQERSQT